MNEINKILLDDYKLVPFHNFWLLLNKKPIQELGGTCSDKTLFLKKKLLIEGVNSNLHSAVINNKNIHRLLKIDIDNKKYFLDVGLGWPIVKPVPIFKNIELNHYGVKFKTEIKNNVLTLSRVKEKINIITYTTTTNDMNQEKIINEINDRFTISNKYPFSNSIRFSKIIDNKFYFLKGNILKYTKKNKIVERKINNLKEYEYLFRELFKFDYDLALLAAKKTLMFEGDIT